MYWMCWVRKSVMQCLLCCGPCSVVQPRWLVAGVALAIARGAVGAAEAAMIPAGLKASSEWFPAKERSIAVGYFNVGSSIGAMIAPPLVVWAIVMHSWQMAFIISGALSFIWAMAWLIFYKHPRDQKHLTDEERDYIINGQEAQHQVSTAKKMSVGQILRNRQFWGIALPRFPRQNRPGGTF